MSEPIPSVPETLTTIILQSVIISSDCLTVI